MGRLGLFGGTFDPPHLGHLLLAQWSAEALALDALWFVPAADPPHKQDRAISPVTERLAMLERALADNSLFVLSRIDVDRLGPHYTVDMVALARQKQPEAEWFFLMGADSLRDLPTWHQPARLIQRCKLAVFQRPGVSYDLEQLEAMLPGLGDRVTFIDGPRLDLSGTDIRARVQAGLTIRYLVPDAVRAYIAAHDLYTTHS